MPSETFSESTDFPQGFNATRFHQDVEAAGLSVNITGVTKKGDVITVDFDGTPSGADLTTLDGVVSGHQAVAVIDDPAYSPESLLVAPDGSLMISSQGEIYTMRETN